MLLHKGNLQQKKTYVYLSQLVTQWHGWFLIWSNPNFFLTDLRTTLFNLGVKKYFLSNFISNIFNTRKLPVGSVPPDCWPYPEVSHVSEGMGASTSWMGTHPSSLWTDTHLWKHYLPAISLADGNKMFVNGDTHQSTDGCSGCRDGRNYSSRNSLRLEPIGVFYTVHTRS